MVPVSSRTVTESTPVELVAVLGPEKGVGGRRGGVLRSELTVSVDGVRVWCVCVYVWVDGCTYQYIICIDLYGYMYLYRSQIYMCMYPLISTHTHTHTVYVCVYVCVYLSVCVCVCVCV